MTDTKKKVRRNQLTEYGKEIKQKMICKDMTVNDLAEKCGVDPSFISKVLYGEKRGIKYASHIGRILDIDVSKYGFANDKKRG